MGDIEALSSSSNMEKSKFLVDNKVDKPKGLNSLPKSLGVNLEFENLVYSVTLNRRKNGNCFKFRQYV